MSCALTQGYTIGCKEGIGGISDIFLSSSATATMSSGSVITLSTTEWVKIETVRNTGSFSESIIKDKATGTVAIEATLTFTVNNLNVDTRQLALQLKKNLFKVIVRDRNGDSNLLGIYNGMRLVDQTSGPGTSATDRSGHSFTLKGMEREFAPIVPANLVRIIDGTQPLPTLINVDYVATWGYFGTSTTPYWYVQLMYTVVNSTNNADIIYVNGSDSGRDVVTQLYILDAYSNDSTSPASISVYSVDAMQEGTRTNFTITVPDALTYVPDYNAHVMNYRSVAQTVTIYAAGTMVYTGLVPARGITHFNFPAGDFTGSIKLTLSTEYPVPRGGWAGGSTPLDTLVWSGLNAAYDAGTTVQSSGFIDPTDPHSVIWSNIDLEPDKGLKFTF